jgi:glycosyltransferase involved in cell wall biosynthesis
MTSETSVLNIDLNDILIDFRNMLYKYLFLNKIDIDKWIANEEVLITLKQSHIFLYPSIWVETSCIAMIEAIKCGCTVIHPSLGALPETAGGATIMYDYVEDPNAHANMAYKMTKALLIQETKNPGFIDSLAADTIRELNKNSIPNFKAKWVSLLTQLKTNG